MFSQTKGDWKCKKCGNVNWESRKICNLCGMPKEKDQGERNGVGGGFNERQDSERKEHASDDDDMYDAFGRKKKKYRYGNRQAATMPVNEPEKKKESRSRSGSYSSYSSDSGSGSRSNSRSNSRSHSRRSRSNSRSNSRRSSRKHSRSNSRRSSRKHSRSNSRHDSRKHARSRSRDYSRSQRSRSYRHWFSFLQQTHQQRPRLTRSTTSSGTTSYRSNVSE